MSLSEVRRERVSRVRTGRCVAVYMWLVGCVVAGGGAHGSQNAMDRYASLYGFTRFGHAL